MAGRLAPTSHTLKIPMPHIQPDEIAKLRQRLDDDAKSQHSKNSIFMFFLFATILLLSSDLPFWSFWTLVFYILGMFLASLLSIPSYLLKAAIAKRITADPAGESKVAAFRLPMLLVELASDFAATWILYRIFVALVS